MTVTAANFVYKIIVAAVKSDKAETTKLVSLTPHLK